MAMASWNGQVIAESDNCEIVEGNVYFPPQSVRGDLLRASEHTSICHWKGKANYYDLVVDGETNSNAAWYYADPKPAAANIKGYIAFWNGVDVRR